eukprot:3941961-Rhodomonas_salina.8
MCGTEVPYGLQGTSLLRLSFLENLGGARGSGFRVEDLVFRVKGATSGTETVHIRCSVGTTPSPCGVSCTESACILVTKRPRRPSIGYGRHTVLSL